MNAFVFSLAVITALVFGKYFIVIYQSKKAIRIAHNSTVQLVMNCEKWLSAIKQMSGIDESMKSQMTQDILRTVKKAGHIDEFYWKAYYQDFNYNKLWLDPTKWTLSQMYPTLIELTKVEMGKMG